MTNEIMISYSVTKLGDKDWVEFLSFFETTLNVTYQLRKYIDNLVFSLYPEDIVTTEMSTVDARVFWKRVVDMGFKRIK